MDKKSEPIEIDPIVDYILEIALSILPYFVALAGILWIVSISLRILIGPVDESDGTNEMEEIYRENPHLRK